MEFLKSKILSAALFGVAFGGGLRAEEFWPGFPALWNGDSNSDGSLDLSDAIHLLSWLYAGGPDPADAPRDRERLRADRAGGTW